MACGSAPKTCPSLRAWRASAHAASRTIHQMFVRLAEVFVSVVDARPQELVCAHIRGWELAGVRQTHAADDVDYHVVAEAKYCQVVRRARAARGRADAAAAAAAAAGQLHASCLPALRRKRAGCGPLTSARATASRRGSRYCCGRAR